MHLTPNLELILMREYSKGSTSVLLVLKLILLTTHTRVHVMRDLLNNNGDEDGY